MLFQQGRVSQGARSGVHETLAGTQANAMTRVLSPLQYVRPGPSHPQTDIAGHRTVPRTCEELWEPDGEDDSLLQSILGTLQTCHVIPLQKEDTEVNALEQTPLPGGSSKIDDASEASHCTGGAVKKHQAMLVPRCRRNAAD